MVCAKCGYLNNDNDKFCGMCGEAILIPVQERQETQGADSTDFTGFDNDSEQQNYQQDFQQQDFSQQDFSQQDFSQQNFQQQNFQQQNYQQQDFSQQNFQQQNFSQQSQIYAPPANASQPASADPGQTLGIVALVLGVLSILSTCCSIFFIPGLGLPFGIAAVVCGALGMKKSKAAGKTNTMATVGLVMGIPALVVSIISTVISVCMIIFGAGASLFYEFF